MRDGAKLEGSVREKEEEESAGRNGIPRKDKQATRALPVYPILVFSLSRWGLTSSDCGDSTTIYPIA